MSHLPHWKVWCDWVRVHRGSDPDRFPIAIINRANARYGLATRFKGITLEGFSKTTTAGYESALRLMLCYSAAEAVFKALGQKITDHQMDDPELAKALRTLFLKSLSPQGDDGTGGQAELKTLTEELRSGTLRPLESFLNQDHDNIRVAATAMRHLMAHGTLTLNGLNLTTKRQRQVVDRLSARLMTEAAMAFEIWLTLNIGWQKST